MADAKAPNPAYRRPEAQKALAQLDRLRAFTDGTDAVRENVRAYLPQHEKESTRKYKMRANTVPVTGFLDRVLTTMVGMLFAVAPKVEPASVAEIADDWQDIDGAGNHGDVFSAMLCYDAIRDGFVGLLIDMQATEVERVPKTQARTFRPYWRSYERSQVLNWRTKAEEGRTVLTMLALMETVEEEGEDGFEVVEAEQVRVFRRVAHGNVTVETWRKKKVGTETRWMIDVLPLRYRGPEEIPFVVVSSVPSLDRYRVRSPILAMADKVIEMWQAACDIRHYERNCCFPQPVIVGQLNRPKGEEQGAIILGATTGLNVQQGGSFSWAELAGTSFAQLRAGQAERLRELATMGLSFLTVETRQAETAEAKRLDSAAEKANLRTMSRAIEDALNEALKFHAAYYNVKTESAPTLALNKNLDAETLDPQMVALLHTMYEADSISDEEWRALMVRGRVFPPEMGEPDAVSAAARAREVGREVKHIEQEERARLQGNTTDDASGGAA